MSLNPRAAKISPSFWRGKRVLVTGHTGFKGAWMTSWLSLMGADVHGIALKPETSPNIFTALDLPLRCKHHVLDIRERENLLKLVREINPEVVFHMAAQPLVRLSYRNPLETYETNVIGTGNLLWALKDCSAVRSIVVITTDKCYENREWAWGYRENDALGGFDPYSSSKACTEILTASFRRSFFPPEKNVGVATVRAGNVIGGGDWSEDRLLPDAVRAIQNKSRLEIRYPDSIRPWQHVLVPLSGYLLLGEKLFQAPQEWSEAFNFAPNDEDCVPVRTVLDKFALAWGTKLDWFTNGEKQLHEAHFLKLDSSKAKSSLHWRPFWNLDEGLKASAEWYRTYYEDPQDLAGLTKAQIETAMSSF